MKQVTGSMGSLVKSMDSVLRTMDLEKISKLLEKFERQFEALDAQSSYSNEDVSQTTEATVSQDEVEKLMKQTADELGLELSL